MQNLKEDLVEECCKFPKAVKRTIYRDPNIKFTTMYDKPTKGKIYNMNEKFDYVLSKISNNYREEFNRLEQKSKNRIMKLFNAYNEWQFPISSSALATMQKETKVDTARLAKLLRVAGLVFHDKHPKQKQSDSYTWFKAPSTPESALESLIEKRSEMTDWENNYYGAHKKKEREQKRKEKEGMAFSETTKHMVGLIPENLPKEVEPQVPSKTEPHTFIEELQMKYELMLDMFPKTSKKELQKLFLQLCLKELEE